MGWLEWMLVGYWDFVGNEEGCVDWGRFGKKKSIAVAVAATKLLV